MEKIGGAIITKLMECNHENKVFKDFLQEMVIETRWYDQGDLIVLVEELLAKYVEEEE